MPKVVKLFEIAKRGILVRYADMPESDPFTFDHVDGMYSFCIDKHGNPIHPAAWTEVVLVEEGEKV